MTDEKYNLIKEELKLYLNRDPNEAEIQNGQTDVNIMMKVTEKQNAIKEQINLDKIKTLEAEIIKPKK